MIRIVFFGTSEFAVPSLEALVRDGRFEIVAVVTRPDRPVGRHATITPPPVKVAAVKLGIPIFQPEKLKELPRDALAADLFVVISYGKILPQWLLDLPKHGCVNVHGSLLPRWRGASPIQAAIAAGDTESGVTIMKMDAELDHGPILAMKSEPIRTDDTGGSLHNRLAILGAEMLPETLAKYLDETITPQEQHHAHATTCRILTRDDGKIDWTKSAEEIERLVRAYNPWPGTWTIHEEKRLKVLSVHFVGAGLPRPGRGDRASTGTFAVDGSQLTVTCGDDNVLELTSVQPEGGKRMSGEEFVRGLNNHRV